MTQQLISSSKNESSGWLAQWLWLPEDKAKAQATLLFQRTFDLNKPAPDAALRISAGHIYQLYLNGQAIGRGPARSDPRFRYFDTYHIADRLTVGENRIVCLVHHMRPCIEGDHRQWNLYDGPGGLLVEIDLGGDKIITDDRWRVARAPGWHDTAIAGHHFHPAIHDVDVPTFSTAMRKVLTGEDDLPWQAPACMATGSHTMYGAAIAAETPPPRPIPHEPVRIRSVFNRPRQIDPRPKSVMLGPSSRKVTVASSPEGGWLIFDLPHPMAGSYDLAVRTEGSAILDIYCGEGSESHLADRLHVSGACRFQPLDWRGGDRVAMHVREATAPVALEHFHFIEWRYPYEPRGDFHTSSDMLNTLWQICQRTAWQGTQDHLVDCVWREQALWIEDVYVHARAIRAAFGDMRPVAKALRQALQLMDQRGFVPVPGPAGVGYQTDRPALRWTGQPLTLPLTARDHYWYTQDEALADWCVTRFESLLRFYQAYEDSRGLLHTSPEQKQSLEPFGGWDPLLKTGVPTSLNSLYALALSAAAELAQATGRASLASTWRARADHVVAVLRDTFWDDDRCVMIDGERDGELVPGVSLTTNAWAALAGAVPMNRAGAWAEALRHQPASIGPTTPYDATTLLTAFAAMDLELHVRELLETYFGSIVAHGHPTLPEYWRSRDSTLAGTQQDSSRCHAYGTGPVFVSHEYILGVQPIEPGYRELRIRPRALGLTHASGRVPTPQGDVAVQWRRDATRWAVTVELPAGVAATVELPWHRETLFVNDEPIWSAPRWSYMGELARRAEGAVEPRVINHRLNGPGRYAVRLEAR